MSGFGEKCADFYWTVLMVLRDVARHVVDTSAVAVLRRLDEVDMC